MHAGRQGSCLLLCISSLDCSAKPSAARRYSAIVEDGVIKTLNVEPDGSGLTCSLANVVLKQLKES